MNNLFIILIIGVICVIGLTVVFFLAYNEEIANVIDAIEHGEDNDTLF